MTRTDLLTEVLVPLVLVVVAGGGALWLTRVSRAAWRTTDHDALEVVIDPRATSERTEMELTAMLFQGDLDATSYRCLLSALARDHDAALNRSEPTNETDQRRAN